MKANYVFSSFFFLQASMNERVLKPEHVEIYVLIPLGIRKTLCETNAMSCMQSCNSALRYSKFII